MDWITQLTQILSGLFFASVVFFLIWLNSEPLHVIKHASIEKRLSTCIAVAKYLATFSAVFNITQLTDLDDVAFQRSTEYTLDLSRPLEWICTCPLLQVILVLIAGKKVPDYRLYFMPALAAVVLLLGVAASSAGAIWLRASLFVLATILVLVLFGFNRKQILEYSDGEEGLFSGSSDFRYFTVLILLTWAPFPVWYLLSPEGLEYLTDPVVVNIGWAVLNIFAKGSCLLHLQRVSSNYFRDVRKSAKEFSSGLDVLEGSGNKFSENIKDLEVPIETLIKESLDWLGLGKKAGALKDLLARARVTKSATIDELDEATVRDLRLPWEIVFVLKCRLSTRKLDGGGGGRGQDLGQMMQLAAAMDTTRVDPKQEAIMSKLASATSGRVEETLEEALAEAEQAKLGESKEAKLLMDVGKARLQELSKLKVVQVHAKACLKLAMEADDTNGLQEAIAVAEAAGLEADAQKARAHSQEVAKMKKAASAHLKKGTAHYKQQEYEDALAAYSAALAKHSKSPLATLNRAIVHRQLGNWAEAEQDAKKALETQPENAKAHHCLALALYRMGRTEDARQACWAGLSKHPTNEAMLQLSEEMRPTCSGGYPGGATERLLDGGDPADAATSGGTISTKRSTVTI